MANRKIIETGRGTVGQFSPILYDGKKLSEQQVKLISDFLVSLAAALNGNLSFGDGTPSSRGGNFHAQWVSQVFAVADEEVEIPHGLGRMPTDVWFGVPDKACRFYTAKRGSWGKTTIWLNCDTANVTVPILIF